ncbi:MAG TPA: Uma2 family endonuclease [Thermoanaerobaculia bacterium]|jgi:Uma2 family endonuclease|nr:Uma2 family endonuclease [Thermoanaerobaculia bacterium]
MAVATIEAHRWNREEFERLAAQGFFPPGQRVELVDGIVYDMAPQNSFHATAFGLSQEALRAAFPPGSNHVVRGQLPLALSEDSQPEPDLAVVPGTIRDYRDSHPSTALLIVEVADSSLLHDRKRKIPLYARHGIPEAWLLNLVRRVLEVYRDPAGRVYQARMIFRAGDAVSPLSRPEISIPIADLLP